MSPSTRTTDYTDVQSAGFSQVAKKASANKRIVAPISATQTGVAANDKGVDAADEEAQEVGGVLA